MGWFGFCFGCCGLVRLVLWVGCCFWVVVGFGFWCLDFSGLDFRGFCVGVVLWVWFLKLLFCGVGLFGCLGVDFVLD